jgi:hypothetical protein
MGSPHCGPSVSAAVSSASKGIFTGLGVQIRREFGLLNPSNFLLGYNSKGDVPRVVFSMKYHVREEVSRVQMKKFVPNSIFLCRIYL